MVIMSANAEARFYETVGMGETSVTISCRICSSREPRSSGVVARRAQHDPQCADDCDSMCACALAALGIVKDGPLRVLEAMCNHL